MPATPKPPIVPAPRGETVRQRIVDLLRGGPLTSREISAEAGIRGKEVPRHLEHIRKSLQRGEGRLEIEPAGCRSCGFAFSKRERLDRPGRCPVCRGESIAEPRFSIRRGADEV